MKIVFLPIKPLYAERIIRGDKIFEFRRRPISADVTHIIVYASSPKKRIVGVVEVNSVICASPNSVWRMTIDGAGISRKEYCDYFNGTDKAYALVLKPEGVQRLTNELSPSEIQKDFKVPQSFMYVDKNFLKAVISKGCVGSH